MRSSEVRKTFLDFFAARGHAVLPSSPVVPHGDPTLLFTNAGMVQFKEIFTGRQPPPEPPRAATVQKCIRAGGKHNDLDNVGYTSRHLTFFEMLGNFSFGDYFKREAIGHAWELVTAGYGLDASDLWVTVYRDDDEARRLWQEVAGLPEERVVGMGEADNYWSMGEVGPCGPCSEILVDRGDRFGEADIENGERFFEIWNLVFMQYDQAPGGERSPLPRPSIDTGMGLERIAMVLQGVDSVFDTDIFRALIAKIEELTGIRYDRGEAGVPHRVLADHVRSLVFALADGAEISNEGRGYVVRRILRRAARYGRKLMGGGPIVCRLVDTLVEEMGEAYPEIGEVRDLVTKQIRIEEERFGETLDRGIELFEEVVARVREEGRDVVPGDEIFRLYDTFGFPLDLVERMGHEAGLGVDTEGFRECMETQRERSRGSAGFAAAAVAGEDIRGAILGLPESEFTGYDRLEDEGELLLARADGEGRWRLVLSRTPFYGEAGGQVGDTGRIEVGDVRLRVEDTQREQGRWVHLARIEAGDPSRLRPGETARAVVDASRRLAIRRHHSATHLLHAALRQVLGTHVRQKGSLVAPDRLRFDVTHFSAISPGELEEVTELVRAKVLEDVPVEVREMGREEALESGALALFGEKYGERVRVVRMGDFSVELCGGTHVERTGQVGPFLIAQEGSVSSGVRRIEAFSGEAAESVHEGNAQLIQDLSNRLKTRPEQLLERVDKLLQEERELRDALEKARARAGQDELRRQRIGDALLVSGELEGLGGKELRGVWDRVKTEDERVACVLFGTTGGKVQILCAVSPALEKAGWSARDLFAPAAEVLGARGGGRPGLVQAGGGDPARAAEALEAVERQLRAEA